MSVSTPTSKTLFVYEIAHQVREALADEKFRKRTNEVVIEAMEEQWTLLNNERESNATLHRKHMAWHEGGCEGKMPPRPKVNRGTAHTLDDWPFPVEHGIDEAPGCILLLAAVNDFAADNPDQFRKKDCEFESLKLNIAVFPEKENEEEELSEEEEVLASWAHYGFAWVMAVSKLTTKHESRLRQAIKRALIEIRAGQEDEGPGKQATDEGLSFVCDATQHSQIEPGEITCDDLSDKTEGELKGVVNPLQAAEFSSSVFFNSSEAAGVGPSVASDPVSPAKVLQEPASEERPAEVESQQSLVPDEAATIPVEYRTRFMSKKEAARKHGFKDSNPAQYINRLIEKGPDGGGIRDPMGGGQQWIFDIRDFPVDVRHSIRPTS